MFTLNLSRSRKDGGTLVEQIVSSIEQELRHGTFAAGTALPSVRGLAKQHGLSAYTVAEAYQRLVSLGLIASRPGAGYRVATVAADAPAAPVWNAPTLNAAWLLSDVFADQSIPIKAGCGWIPNDWINESGLQHALRTVSRTPGARIGGYGHPYGLASLREYIGASLRRYSLAVGSADVLLTEGATQVGGTVQAAPLSGAASASFTLPAAQHLGTYSVIATYDGGNSYGLSQGSAPFYIRADLIFASGFGG